MLRIVFTAAPLLLIGANVATGQTACQRVNVKGMQMYYEVSGAGDPLIVLHGAYMNRRQNQCSRAPLTQISRLGESETCGNGWRYTPLIKRSTRSGSSLIRLPVAL